ncbi:MAG: DUF302 domain-containing protein, partial [Chlorobi bacterium]|nr:DUF302 domain-containing protein [Chlorobiota bacterium]
MKKQTMIISIILFTASIIFAGAGMIKIKSSNNVKTTAEKLVKVLDEKGMTVFNQINFTKGAESVGKELRPMILVIFGNPNIGT